MQNKKNKKQNGGEAEGKIIFTYVLLTFLLGFIGYCIYWCFISGPENSKEFFRALDEGKWENARGKFLESDLTGQEYINEGNNLLSKILGKN